MNLYILLLGSYYPCNGEILYEETEYRHTASDTESEDEIRRQALTHHATWYERWYGPEGTIEQHQEEMCQHICLSCTRQFQE